MVPVAEPLLLFLPFGHHPDRSDDDGGGQLGAPCNRDTCRVSDGATPVSRGRLIGDCI